MSRSNPSEHATNPSERRFEWDGSRGLIRHYDPTTKTSVDDGETFGFVLLDVTSRIGGWDKSGDCGIYSNEVKDLKRGVLVVKSKKSGTLASGPWEAIKADVKAQGAKFVSNLYIAWKNGDGQLKIGTLKMQGASLGAWMEFQKEHRDAIYEQAIAIVDKKYGKKGKTEYYTPIFEIKPLGAESHTQAVALDKELQKFLGTYFDRAREQQADHHEDEAPEAPYDDSDEYADPIARELSDIPF